ncbi:MAG: DUF7544 domain-containing protein [Anaerolineales bacterium]
MDPIKILRRAWYILWNYRALWVFGLILALAAGSSTGNSSNNRMNYQQDSGENPQVTPQSMQEAFRDFQREINKLFEQGLPDVNISGQELTTFLWVIGAFVLFMLVVGIVVAVARYVSETAVIRMVDEFEDSGNKMTVREGFRVGWSRTAWRLFLINLIVNLPVIALMLVLLIAGIGIYFAVVNGNADFAAFSVVSAIVLGFITIFVVVILTILLHLLRHFFWRISVLENASVGESLQRGFAMVLENWKSVGLMWLVMIGLGIVWAIASIILAIVTIPLVIVTAVIAVLVVALPFLLLVGLFSTFLGSFLPWIAAGLFVAPLFFPIAFLPWVLLSSWQTVYTSTVWTLTYREIKALPAIAQLTEDVPVGD